MVELASSTSLVLGEPVRLVQEDVHPSVDANTEQRLRLDGDKGLRDWPSRWVNLVGALVW